MPAVEEPFIIRSVCRLQPKKEIEMRGVYTRAMNHLMHIDKTKLIGSFYSGGVLFLGISTQINIFPIFS
jgi:hypothetical protein